jgi:uncharacterized protein (DUF2141 family)
MRAILPFMLIFLFSNTWYNNRVPESEVEVAISNIKSPKGVFVISFYNDEKLFPKPGKDILTEKFAVKDTTARIVKIKLPAQSWYAIAMFQDEDENGKIKQDKIGVPLEAYAFSNNIHPKTSAPSFAACKFFVEANRNSSIAIKLMQPVFSRKK